MAIQHWIAQGVARAAEELSETHAIDSRIEVRETRCCALGDFGSAGLCSSYDDLTACVILSFRGPLSGGVLLCMDPEDALAWSRADSAGGDSVRAYIGLGRRVIGAVVESAADVLEASTDLGTAELAETSVAGCLIRTHAPSDTVVIYSQISILAAGRFLPADLYLMLDPKRMSAMLGALSVSAH